MKISQSSPLLEKEKIFTKAKVRENKSEVSQEVTDSPVEDRDQVRAELAKTLQETILKIESEGLSAGQMHSNIDEDRATGLLRSMAVESKRPKLSEKDLLALADTVSHLSLSNPQAALAAFTSIDGERAAELLSQ